MKYIGLDLGAASIAALILDTEQRRILAKKSVDNDARLAAPKGRSEWDIDRMVQLAFGLLSAIAKTSEGVSSVLFSMRSRAPLRTVYGGVERKTRKRENGKTGRELHHVFTSLRFRVFPSLLRPLGEVYPLDCARGELSTGNFQKSDEAPIRVNEGRKA